MNTIEFIKAGLEASKNLTLGLIDDMKDAPLTMPTSNGGNHPLWILGHLAYSEANIVHHIIQGNENPLIGWKEIFGGGSEPVADATVYPSFDELRQTYEEIHAYTLNVLEGLTVDDLNKPSKNCPPERDEFMGKIGQCFMVLTLHPVMHRGQVADARRMLNREPVFA